MKKEFYFQILQGESIGKILKLTGIKHEHSDINPDPMLDAIYFIFSDGSKCNMEAIAEMNDYTAYNSSRFYMIRIFDENNIWKFERKEAKKYSQRTIYNSQSGMAYHGIDPDQTFIDQHHLNNDRIIATPPKLVINRNDPNAIAQARNMIRGNQQMLSNVRYHIQNNENKGFENVVQTSNDFLGDRSAMTASAEDIQRFSNSLVKIPVGIILVNSKILKNAEIENFLKAHPGGIIKDAESPRQPAKRIEETMVSAVSDSSDDREIQTEKTESGNAATDTTDKVNPGTVKEKETIPSATTPAKAAAVSSLSLPVTPNSPVIGIISKCKKVSVKANFVLNLSIPSRSIYELIRDNFDKQAVDDFYNIIINDISNDKIKKSLREALENSYEIKDSSI